MRTLAVIKKSVVKYSLSGVDATRRAVIGGGSGSLKIGRAKGPQSKRATRNFRLFAKKLLNYVAAGKRSRTIETIGPSPAVEKKGGKVPSWHVERRATNFLELALERPGTRRHKHCKKRRPRVPRLKRMRQRAECSPSKNIPGRAQVTVLSTGETGRHSTDALTKKGGGKDARPRASCLMTSKKTAPPARVRARGRT